MHKELLRSIAGIEVFPIISLCLFIVVFAVAAIKAWRLDGRSVSHLSHLPLETDADANTKKEVTL